MDRRHKPPAAPSGRPRILTCLFTAVLAGGLIFANTIGRLDVAADVSELPGGNNERGVTEIRSTEAGFPWTYVTIREYRVWPLANLENGVSQRSIAALVANVALGAAGAAAATWLFAQWRLRRRRILQFGLLDVVAATGLVAAILAFGLLPRMQHARDAAVLAPLRSAAQANALDPFANPFRPRSADQDADVRRAVWHPGQSQWLRDLIGETRLPPTGHVVGISIRGSRAAEAARLPRLQVVQIFGDVSDRKLNLLGELPELNYLDLSEAVLRRDKGTWLDTADYRDEYPLRMPRLRRLYAAGTVLQGSDLTGCSALEELDLSRTVVDLPSAQAIGRLSSLRVLNLRHTDLQDQELAALAGLGSLQSLDISHTAVTDRGLAHLKSLPSLQTLWIAGTSVTDEGLIALEDCPQLTPLRSTGTKITARGVARLQRARRERLAAR